ncbi:hypothetical protein PInf_004807 [Phytophthora infestans]|nr:hypothetical protein PInf_004807 [Phytophthora infestans]
MMLRRYYWKMETMNVETATRRMKVLLNLTLNGQELMMDTKSPSLLLSDKVT